MFETSAPVLGFDGFLTNSILPLTEQQYAFLQTWQKGNYPIEVDLAFIESLKHQMRLLNLKA